MVGKPVIRGTRIPVELIVRMLAQGISEDDILKEYPRLRTEDIRAALAYDIELAQLALSMMSEEDYEDEEGDDFAPF